MFDDRDSGIVAEVGRGTIELIVGPAQDLHGIHQAHREGLDRLIAMGRPEAAAQRLDHAFAQRLALGLGARVQQRDAPRQVIEHEQRFRRHVHALRQTRELGTVARQLLEEADDVVARGAHGEEVGGSDRGAEGEGGDQHGQDHRPPRGILAHDLAQGRGKMARSATALFLAIHLAAQDDVAGPIGHAVIGGPPGQDHPRIMAKLNGLGVDKSVTGLVMPAGLSFNMDGSCIYLTMAIGFIPQALNVPLTWETLRIILPYSLTMAAVGLLESLLTAQIVDDMTDTDSDKRRECGGQGVANIAAALVGGMGGCAMIGQSVINVTSGGRGRLSTFVAGAFLLFLLAQGRGLGLAIKSFVLSLVWIQLWPPLYAILNYVATLASAKNLEAAARMGAAAQGLALETASTIYHGAISDQAVAGYMVISIPIIATAIIKGGEVAFQAVTGVGPSGQACRRH